MFEIILVTIAGVIVGSLTANFIWNRWIEKRINKIFRKYNEF